MVKSRKGQCPDCKDGGISEVQVSVLVFNCCCNEGPQM